MEQSLGWHKAIEDLAGNHVQIREQYREIARWFPSVKMMRNHARGLVKERLHPEILLGPSGDSNDDRVSDDDFVELFDDEEEVEVEMVGAVVAAVEGDKEIPIDVEKLPDVRDLEALRVKKELQDEEEELSQKKCKIPIPVKVRRSERVKKMQE
ncbi:hypothetical protein ZWY2020_045223 [Hordeum vulgare]|nr:hypothetical protein ZWY2020_045223 [Hordeum vulgare]